MQSTFLNAHRALQRGVTPEAELAWLFKIAHNVCLTRRRSTRRRGRVEAASDLQAMQDVIPAPSRENADDLIRLTDALAHMPDNQRRAILLREWQGLSYHEIADELGLSQSAVETLIFRARRSLASNLEAEPERTGLVARARAAFDLGSLLMAAKTLLGGGTAVKAAATAVAVSGAAVIATAPMKPAPVKSKSDAPVTALETSAPVVAAEPRDATIASAPANEQAKKPAAKHEQFARSTSKAPSNATSDTPLATAPVETQVSDQPAAVAPTPEQSSRPNEGKGAKAGIPAQVVPVEQPKAKPAHAGNGKPENLKDTKAEKEAAPQPPAGVAPEPVESSPAQTPDEPGRSEQGHGNGHNE